MSSGQGETGPAAGAWSDAPRPALRVMKFGGTSVAGADRLRRVAALVAAALAEERVVVVVSALAGVTNDLLAAVDRAAARAGEEGAAVARFRRRHDELAAELADELGTAAVEAVGAELAALAGELERALAGVALLGECPPRTRAQVAALGERASSGLLAALLAARCGGCERLDPRRVLPCAGDPLEAEPRPAEIRARLADWRAGAARLALLPGFFGGDARGEPVLLGRGGSDDSAALVAQALDARLLEIWTDVPGIFTADPRRVAGARAVAEASFEEAMELAHFGAKVLHPKSVAPARAAGIPVRICDTFHPEHPGTLLAPRSAPAGRVACALTLLPGVALLSIAGPGMKGVPGVAARAFAALAERGLSVMLITQGSSECVISVGLPAAEAGRALAALGEAFAAEIATGRVDEVDARQDLAILSLVGDGMRHRAGVAAGFFGALGEAGVNVVAIAQGGSERSICAVLDERDGDAALNAVHARFFADAATAPPLPALPPAPASARVAGGSASVAVFAPASIGNLAAGFDVLGAAVAPLDGEPWGDVVEASLASDDSLRVVGPFADRLPADPRQNLVWQARAAVERQLGRALPPLALVLHKGLPVASGLGSSAASAVAAVVAIDELLDGPLGAERRLRAAAEAEGFASGAAHLDNVAPILAGGVRLVAPGERVSGLPWPDELRFVVVSPALELATRAARAVLPREVPLALAVAHAQNLAALVHALHAGDRTLLAATLRDLLAEPYRAPLVPGFAAVQAAALAAGALGCSLSGAGPALFAVAAGADAERVGAAAVAAWGAAGVASRARVCALDRRGARRIEVRPWS